MDIIYVLLCIIAFLMLKILIRLRTIISRLENYHSTNCAYNKDHLAQREEMLGEKGVLGDILYELECLKRDVEIIKNVLDIYSKYELPR